MKRKRIVIDFDPARAGSGQPPAAIGQPAGAGKARRGVGRVLIIIGVVLLLVIGVVVGGAYFWWLTYQRSPAYSLALLADASQRNDTAAIDALFDTEKVTDDFVSQVRQRTSPLSALPFSAAAPVLTPKLRQTVHDEFVKELRRLTEPAAGKPFILVALAVTSFADIKQEDKMARVAVNIKDEHLQLTMQPVNDRWRIVAVQDEKLAKLVADSIIRSVPGISSPGAQIEDEIRKQLEKFKSR